jgi:hypothetical protein
MIHRRIQASFELSQQELVFRIPFPSLQTFCLRAKTYHSLHPEVDDTPLCTDYNSGMYRSTKGFCILIIVIGRFASATLAMSRCLKFFYSENKRLRSLKASNLHLKL